MKGAAQADGPLPKQFPAVTPNTFLLGVHSAEYADMAVYSIESPLGAAIAGARPGERRTHRLTNGAELAVTLLKAVPYGITPLIRTNPHRDEIGESSNANAHMRLRGLLWLTRTVKTHARQTHFTAMNHIAVTRSPIDACR